MLTMKKLREKSFANIGLGTLAKLTGIETTNKRKAVTRNSRYKHTYLTATDVKLYVLLHFLTNSTDGTAHMVITRDLTEVLDAEVKTVMASFHRLKEQGLVEIVSSTKDPDDYDIVDITIIGYSDMFKKRGEGGNGYYTMTEQFLKAVLQAKGINELRVLLRLVASTVTEELNSASKEAAAILTYDDLRKGLPAYVKPCVLKKALEAVQDLFSGIDQLGKKVILSLAPEYQGRAVKSRVRAEAECEIGLFVDSVNDTVYTAAFDISSGINEVDGVRDVSDDTRHKFYDLGICFDSVPFRDNGHPDCYKAIPELKLTTEDRKDCITLAQDYGIWAVKRMLAKFYETYLIGGIKLPDIGKSLGGLFRELLRYQKIMDLVSCGCI